MKAIASLLGKMPTLPALPRTAGGGSAARVIHLPDHSRRAPDDDFELNLFAPIEDYVERQRQPTRPAQQQQSATPLTARAMNTRLAVLLAALAVPAMAAPGDFGQLPGGAPTEAEMVNARLSAMLADNPPMPFERPGMSFPGSAFFFLADPPSDALIALPTTDALANGAGEAGREVGAIIDAGPGARPFFSAGGTAHERALECLAQAVWYEAASESVAGQRAVAQVVLNRVAHPSWPGSVCGVVYQGSSRSTGCQFTFTCDGSLRRKAGGASWQRARSVASDALSGAVYEPIGHATHYHTLWVNPYWASSLDHVGTIGAHRFYRNRGAAGSKDAFTLRYAGVEPGVKDRKTAPPANEAFASDTTLTSTPAKQPDSGPGRFTAAQTGTASRAPEPILADPSYAGVGQVREDYATAGQWKSDAAREALLADEKARARERAVEGARGTAPGAASAASKPRNSGQKD